MILCLDTSTPIARLRIVADESGETIAETNTELGRSMAHDLPKTIEAILKDAAISWNDLTGIVVFKGPGSFTGLRIGITIANTVAYAQQLPIVAAEGDTWLKDGIARLQAGQDERMALPHYGADAHITQPRK